MKREIRVLGIDDGPFNKFRDRECLVVGAFYRGGSYPDGILSAKVKVDGSDSTSKIIRMVNRSKFRKQLHCIMLDGINLAGFNVVDIERLHKKTGIPVIVVVREYPDFSRIRSALKKMGKPGRFRLLEKAGNPVKAGNVYVQFKGMAFSQAKEIIRLTSTHSYIPEPIRVAHLIGSGIVTGESRGGA
jgi:endonuclease V-like protein UPF0215 family